MIWSLFSSPSTLISSFFEPVSAASSSRVFPFLKVSTLCWYRVSDPRKALSYSICAAVLRLVPKLSASFPTAIPESASLPAYLFARFTSPDWARS